MLRIQLVESTKRERHVNVRRISLLSWHEQELSKVIPLVDPELSKVIPLVDPATPPDLLESWRQ